MDLVLKRSDVKITYGPLRVDLWIREEGLWVCVFFDWLHLRSILVQVYIECKVEGIAILAEWGSFTDKEGGLVGFCVSGVNGSDKMRAESGN